MLSVGGILFLSLITGLMTHGEMAEAAIRRVPQSYSTIQAAVNAAQSGDTVLVSGGTYREYVTLKGGVRLHAAAGSPTEVIIDASNLLAPGGRDYVVGWTATPDRIEVVGFTLVDNSGSSTGVWARGSNHLIEGNIVKGQVQYGIFLDRTTNVLVHNNRVFPIVIATGIQVDLGNFNRVVNNYAYGDGTGISISGGDYNGLIGNVAYSPGARPVPAGISVINSGKLVLEHNTAYQGGGNTEGAGLRVEVNHDRVIVKNCILRGGYYGIKTYSASNIDVTYSDVAGGVRNIEGTGVATGDGVIFADPLLIEPFGASDMRLQPLSPARNSGSGTDRDGSRADMGAYGGIH